MVKKVAKKVSKKSSKKTVKKVTKKTAGKTVKKAAKKSVKAGAKPAPKHTPKSTPKSAPKAKAVRHEHFHADGSLWARGQLRGGVMVGTWEFFRKDGTLLRSGEFDDAGEKAGAWTTYDKAGLPYKVTKVKGKPKL